MDAKSMFNMLNLDLGRIHTHPDSSSNLLYEQDVQPFEFLSFAENDLVTGDKQGLVNALSNAKRAIDAEVDKVLGRFALSERRNFPHKMNILRDMGVVAPRIVNKVIRARNLLEHEYKLPDKTSVEDSVDIANLFVYALDSVMVFFCDHYFFGTFVDGKFNKHGEPLMEKEVFVEFDEDNPRFLLTAYSLDNKLYEDGYQRISQYVGQSLITPKDKGYPQLIGISSKVMKPYDVRGDIVKLVNLFK